MAVILPSVYKDGTATVNNGSTTVTGQNTLFVNSVLPGDFFGSSQGVWVRIASVDSNTTLTLSHPWPEASQTASAYEIMLQSDNARMQETSRQLLETLSSGNNYSLGQLNGNVDQIPIFSAPGVFTLVEKSELGSGDVKGPAAAAGLVNKIATFADNTGKLLKAATPTEAGIVIAGYITPGANLSNNSEDAANDLNFPAVVCASTISPQIFMFSPAATSQIDVAFGTGNGGRFDAAVSDGTWHCFIISGADGVGKCGFSKSLVPTGQPNYPANYPHYRRIGSWIRTSGAWEQMIQTEDEFMYLNPKVIRSSTEAFPLGLISLPTPTGLVLDLALSSQMLMAAAGNIQTFVGTPGIGAVVINAVGAAGQFGFQNSWWVYRTNLSSQVNFGVSIFAGSLNGNALTLVGWRDKRGKAG